MIGCTLSVSLVLGPIFGGVISHLSSWRWIFDLKYGSSPWSLDSRFGGRNITGTDTG